MKVLVACEFSGTVRDAFIAKGHDAWSCDILPTESGGPHLQGCVLDFLNRGWDLMIAHPPCTFLSVAGAQYLKTKPGRREQCKEAAAFFNKLLGASIPRIAVENPVQHYEARKYIRAPDQILRMNLFGENAYKPTCLWLKNLPPLKPTTAPVKVKTVRYPNGRTMSDWYRTRNSNSKLRSKTFKGFAEAMADQWSKPGGRDSE